ncbi:unnamed protein product [Adineta steineri]|uniref:Glutathione S-transferase n=2 Tax=Adineta steineri TaxID=433720 RepID=A0A814ZSV9_9BILA|nr:unnamed protein product [Adineta steineri]
MTTGTKPIQLYSLATPNGQKIGIALEEFGLEYDAHLIDISKDVQFEDWFKKINPNSKIPALVDREPNGDDKQPISIFESGAILIYLADKTNKFLAPVGTRQRYETIEWLMWQMGGVGPMFGQANHFHKAAKEQIEYAKKRYLDESKRLLKVLDTQLGKTGSYVSGSDYTIADMAIFPWVAFFTKNYKDQLNDESYSNIDKWLNIIGERPQVKKGLKVCSKDA